MSIIITANDVHTLFRPSPCRRRVFLSANRPELAAPPTEYDRLLMREGREHEQAHLATFPQAVRPRYPVGDLSAGCETTRELVEGNMLVIYQGVLLAPTKDIAGIPDFMLLSDEGWVIRDAKLARNLDDHGEITLQLTLYADAFTDAFGFPPAALEVVLGDGTVTTVPFVEIAQVVAEISALQQAGDVPDEAVGWSKCSECGFKGFCWNEAEKACDPAIVVGVDQGLRGVLVRAGVDTYHKLAELDAGGLAETRKPRGDKLVRVGPSQAQGILRQARVVISGKHEMFAEPEHLPEGPRVYFDIEADPHDELAANKVYLWGVLTDPGDGSQPTYWGDIAAAGRDGDRSGWLQFLDHARGVIEQLGDIPFVHYSHYERTWMTKYISRWGDPDGVGEKVLESLWDMLPKAIQRALCLPIPSYGLKQVEQYAGFQRSQADYGGLWSVVRYREWLEAGTSDERERIADELLRYNREDCEAMQWVMEWAERAANGVQDS
jgi:predicted RecB family nuclease